MEINNTGGIQKNIAGICLAEGVWRALEPVQEGTGCLFHKLSVLKFTFMQGCARLVELRTLSGMDIICPFS